MDFFPSEVDQAPEAIVTAALSHAKIQFSDVLIVDTAGRLAIDEEMMGGDCETACCGQAGRNTVRG